MGVMIGFTHKRREIDREMDTSPSVCLGLLIVALAVFQIPNKRLFGTIRP